MNWVENHDTSSSSTTETKSTWVVSLVLVLMGGSKLSMEASPNTTVIPKKGLSSQKKKERERENERL